MNYLENSFSKLHSNVYSFNSGPPPECLAPPPLPGFQSVPDAGGSETAHNSKCGASANISGDVMSQKGKEKQSELGVYACQHHLKC